MKTGASLAESEGTRSMFRDTGCKASLKGFRQMARSACTTSIAITVTVTQLLRLLWEWSNVGGLQVDNRCSINTSDKTKDAVSMSPCSAGPLHRDCEHLQHGECKAAEPGPTHSSHYQPPHHTCCLWDLELELEGGREGGNEGGRGRSRGQIGAVLFGSMPP